MMVMVLVKKRSDLSGKRNSQCADVGAHIDNCTTLWHMLQDGCRLQMAPFAVQRQEQPKVPAYQPFNELRGCKVGMLHSRKRGIRTNHWSEKAENRCA
jgi:hypothetical protein